jgi:hypothetical protein
VKVLIAVDNKSLISESLKHCSPLLEVDKRLSSSAFNHIELDILETGHTLFETAFLMGKTLATKRYHLALGLGLAGSYNPEHEAGSVVNIINDKPLFFGESDENGFQSVYALKQLNPFEHPHQRGAFINMTNAYFNVFLPILKVPGVTTTHLKGNKNMVEAKLSKFPLDVETSNGLGVHYSCLYERTNFYQLRAISYNLASGISNENLAIENLNNTLTDILNKL